MSFLYYTLYGFMDDGASWTKGRAVFKHNGIEAYLSQPTNDLITKWIFYAGQRDPMGFMWELKDWMVERSGHAMQNTTVFGLIRFVRWLSNSSLLSLWLKMVNFLSSIELSQVSLPFGLDGLLLFYNGSLKFGHQIIGYVVT